MISTVKPSVVAVVLPNAGVNTDVAETVSAPLVYPVRVVVIVAVELVFEATPVTVTKPELHMGWNGNNGLGSD